MYMHEVFPLEELHDIFDAILECVGEFVSRINIFYYSDSDSILAVFLRHCGKLKHLTLATQLTDEGVNLLVEALEGNLGGQLLSLDLNHNELKSTSVEKIAGFLANPTQTPALLDLRIEVSRLDSEQVCASLREAFEVNKTLRFLHFNVPGWNPSEDEDEDEDEDDDDDEEEEETSKVERLALLMEYKLFEDVVQGELLPSVLPLHQKAAFLSAIKHSSAAHCALSKVDDLVVSTIFKFAADQVRRRVLWE